VLLLCPMFLASTFAEDWTEFRGPTGQGLSTARGLPTHWGTETNVAWQKELPGKGWSSPILLGKKLFLTTAVPIGDEGEAGTRSLRAICLDTRNGSILWNVEIFQQPARAPVHGKNSHASATPVTDGKRLFVHFGPHGTACLAIADGTILWRNEELKYSPVHGNGGSPILVDGLLVVSCDGGDQQFVAALDQNKGTVRWRTPRSVKPRRGVSFGKPLVVAVEGKRQIISAGSDDVMAYQPEDVHEIWKEMYSGGYSVVRRLTFGEGLLYVCTGYDSPTLLAIRVDGARGDVTETHVAWRVKKGVPYNPSPLLVGDSLYLIADKGVASC